MAITFEKTPLEWKNSGTEPSADLKENGFSAGYRPAASTFNYQINNTSECLTELQTKLSDLDQDAIKGIKGNGTTIKPSSTGVINITPNNIGAAASTHYHNASQITSGVLPIERGGTGATTLEEALEVFGGGTILYSNESGTTDTTITLSDDVSNYRYVEIYYERVKHTHTPDPVRPEYYADDNNRLTIPSEGLPIATHYFENIEGLSNGFTEDTFACCVGMEKVNIIPTSGVSHFLISTAFIETKNLTDDGAVYNSKDLESTMKQSEYQLNAHLIGNVLSYDFHYMITTYNASWVTSYEFYSQGPYWVRTVANNYNHHTSTSEVRGQLTWKTSGAKYPKVYTIIGYK